MAGETPEHERGLFAFGINCFRYLAQSKALVVYAALKYICRNKHTHFIRFAIEVAMITDSSTALKTAGIARGTLYQILAR